MQGFFSSIFGLFLTPAGILVLAALDSSIIFFLPAAIDTAVIISAARYQQWFWVIPILATAGSVMGAAATFQLGCVIGETGLQRWIPEKRLKSVRQRIGKNGAIAMAVAAILPPPFPLTPFVLTSGALGLNRRKFLAAVAVMRFVRFGLEAVLASIYGRRIAQWPQSEAFEYVAAAIVILASIGTAVTILRVVKRAR